MKKEFCIVIAALLVLSLTACGKSKSANSVPLVDCSDHGSAVEGGCYLMTEETPDEICEEAKVIFSENLAQWVSVFEGGAGEYALGTPYHTHPLDSNGKPTDAYIFPVLHNGEFWRTLDIIELDGETRHQFSPNVEKFQHLHGLSSPENPIRFVWVGNVRYAVVGNNAEIITHEGGDIPDNIGELAAQSDLPDSVVIDISKPIVIAEIAAENESISKEEITNAMEQVNLDPNSRKRVGKYSLGMRQRLGIAQAIMEHPRYLILDEPMNGLDTQGVKDVRELLQKQKEAGVTVILASHSMEDIRLLCDTVHRIQDASLIPCTTEFS